MSQAADPRAKLSRAAVRWALTGLVVHHLTVARVAQALGVSWNTANTAVLAEGERSLINDPTRFEGVRVIGVDEHVWLAICNIEDKRAAQRLTDAGKPANKRTGHTRLIQGHTTTNWKQALAQLTTAYPDRITPYL